MNELTDKVVVVTGASSGFGRGIALGFAEKGAAVVLAARRGHSLTELAEECVRKGGRGAAVTADVSEADDVENLSREALQRFGPIDVWVNNAGVGAIGRFTDIPIQDHEQVVETNLLGTIYGSYFAMQQFQKQRHGTLINIASVLGKVPAPNYASFTASKHGVVGLCDVLRQELAESNLPDVHVCTVMPMAHDPFFSEHAANYSGQKAQPVSPTYDPQKVVNTVVHLATSPQDEVIVGASGKVMNVLHHLIPDVIEKIMEKDTEIAHIRKSPPAPPPSGRFKK